jgi:hypothetical protein
MIDARDDAYISRSQRLREPIERDSNRMRTFLDDEATVCCP